MMIIRVERIKKNFSLNGQRILVLDDVSINIEEGEFVALLGPSGCGKSTLLSLLAGYFLPDEGEITINGSLSYMPQRDMLLPWLNVIENACLPAAIRHSMAETSARAEVKRLLPLFGLNNFGDSLPDQLSGGMRQRAALLRTYMAGGDFWLLDEPFGSLDALTREDLQEWFMDLQQEIKCGVLFVTHDINEALKLSSHIYALSPRPGRISGEWVAKAGFSLAKRELLKKEILMALQ
ncbi:MAG: ATP-binding cassette domain-containing protein [Firmicutes bacterium]|nr:ATP-binding cassette domain-containing protein [Bacillota bacterium]